MRYKEIIRREDGKRVEIRVDLQVDTYRNEFKYDVFVFVCQPKKRTWQSVYDSNSYEFRKMNPEQKRDHIKTKQLEHVSEAEIYVAKFALWKMLEPKSQNPQ